MQPAPTGHPQTLLVVLSVLVRLAIWTLTSLSAYLLPLFDASPKISGTSVLLRWDAFHFTHIAEKGYIYEHEFWFKRLGDPPSRWSMCGHTLRFNTSALSSLVASSPINFLAFLSTALSLLSSSPVALRLASYSEPFFTYLSYRGMLACARSQWAAASLCFTLASLFRSNGMFLSGFIIWGMLIAPFLKGRKDLLPPTRLFKCMLLTALPLIPFIHHNTTAYILFCTSPAMHIPDWCTSSIIPSIYSHVQSKYWNIGFLRYWTVSNIPNFILALPPLLHIFAFCGFYLSNLPAIIPHIMPQMREKSSDVPPPQLNSPFLSPSLLPHVLHALALTLILTFNAHVQISLRLLPSHPLTYWAAARLLVDRPKWGKAWVTWSVMWGAVSCVLWAVFLPPA